MKRFKGIQGYESSATRPVVTIGNFDGVHTGHRRILSQVRERARSLGVPAIVFTFQPHPRTVLKPDWEPLLLTTYEERADLIESHEIDILVEEPFSRDFSNTSAEEFFNRILVQKLNAFSVIVGYDFAFGKGREGGLKVLEDLCSKTGIEFTVTPPFRQNSDVVSSSKIREYLRTGNISNANDLLGYSFFYRENVIRGDQRGRKIGFPTANLIPQGKLILPFGVYATRTTHLDQEFPSITNIGVRPTFQNVTTEASVVVETHLLDQDLDLYGRTIQVRFLEKIRDEVRFPDVETLTAQIRTDIQRVRTLLA